MNLDGRIIKGIGGFYYVEVDDNIYECKLRGIFRKKEITPLVGDKVTISVNEGQENTIDSVYERKNSLKRPLVANIDTLFIVISSTEPEPNTLVIDKLTVIAEAAEIEPVLLFTKDDLKSVDSLFDIYGKTGYKCIKVSDDSIDEIKKLLKGKTSVLTGNSGVGKSTLLNKLDSSLQLQTGQISTKLGRGRHTTRHVELFELCGGYIADTPGFSSVDFELNQAFLKDSIQYHFHEFNDYIGTCKFTGCTHTHDKGCKIIEAVENGDISKSRHDSYLEIYNQVKDIKEWQL